MQNYKELLKGVWNTIKTHIPELINYTQKRVSKKKFKLINNYINFNQLIRSNKDIYSASKISDNQLKYKKLSINIKNAGNKNLDLVRIDISKNGFRYQDFILNIFNEYFYNIKNLSYNELTSNKYLFKNIPLSFDFDLGYTNESIGIFINNIKSSKVIGLGAKFCPLLRDKKVFENYAQDQYYHTYYTDKLYSAQNIFYIINKNYYMLIYTTFPGKVIYDFKKSDENCIGIEFFGKHVILDFVVSKDFKELVKYLYNIINIKDIFPLFIFGNSFSRWGIKDINELKNIINEFDKNGIPVDNIFLDIDYMENYKIFTIDKKKFSNLKEFIIKENKKGVYFIPIIDVGIKEEKSYEVYEEFKKNNLLIKKENNQIFKGKVWPGTSVFPDFLNNKAFDEWKKHYKNFLKNNHFSGFWNDMNEPSIFDSKNGTFEEDVKFCDEKNTCYNEIEIHNIYSYLQNKSSYLAFLELEKRPLIISRADFTSSGKYAGTWTGDNSANFKNLRIGYSQIINYNLIGVPFCGTDLGGFIGDCTEKLITKWYKNSIFHPLFRNHSSKFSKRRDPYLFKDETKEHLKILSLIRVKFSLLIYNQFFKMILYKEPPIKPIFYFYQQFDLFSNDYQLFIEKNVMHILDYRKKELGKIKAFFPEGLWINYFTNEQIISNNNYYNIYSNWFLPDIWIKIPAIFITSNFRSRVVKNIFPVIEIFPDKTLCSYTFFEDDFITNDYKKGIYNKYKVSSRLETNKVGINNNKILNIVINLDKEIKFKSKFKLLTFKVNLSYVDYIVNELDIHENFHYEVVFNNKKINKINVISQMDFNGFIEPDFNKINLEKNCYFFKKDEALIYIFVKNI